MSSSGDITTGVVLSRPGCLQLEHHLPGAVALHPLVGQHRAGDVEAQLLKAFALVGADWPGFTVPGCRRRAKAGSCMGASHDPHDAAQVGH